MSYFQRVLALCALACGWQVYAADAEGVSPHQISAQTCGACHEEIFQQWSNSRHAQSNPLQDPLKTDNYKHLVGDPRQDGQTLAGEYPACILCHAPNAAKDDSTRLDAKTYGEGVNCLVCHTLKEYLGDHDASGKPLYGIAAYRLSEQYLQGPSGRYLSPEADAVHAFPLEPNQGLLRSSEVCMGCHRSYKNPNGVPVCDTGREYEDAGSPVTCQSCHMPKNEYSTDHSMRGGHSETMVTRSVLVTLGAERNGDKLSLEVRMRNMLSHRFPSGIAYRNVYLKLTAYSAKDELLWSNFKSYPLNPSDDPKAVLRYELHDVQGQPASPFEATKVARDNRLRPHEIRQLLYQIPAQGVALVRAEVVYHLLSPQLEQQYEDKLGGDILSPVVAGIAELKVD